jgi:hypothetical protein
MTLGTIRNRFRLMMPEADTGVISNTNLDLLANDAVLDITRRTDCLQNYADQDVTASTQTYDTPSDSIKILGVYYGGSSNWEKLSCVTMDFLANEIDTDWLTATGTIYAYFFAERNKIGLYKIPTSAEAGTNYLRIYYVEQPDALVNDSDIPFNSVTNLYPYHELIILYLMFKVKQIVGKFEQSNQIEANYLIKCREMKVELKKLDDFQQVIRPYYKGNAGSSIL